MKLPEDLKWLLEDVDGEVRYEAIVRDCAKVLSDEGAVARNTGNFLFAEMLERRANHILRRYGLEEKK